MVDRDVVPVGEMLADHLGRARVVPSEVVKRLLGPHDAPAERVVGLVALQHDHLVVRVAQLHADGEVEAGGPTAKTDDFHRGSPVFSPGSAMRLAAPAKNFKLKTLGLKFVSRA